MNTGTIVIAAHNEESVIERTLRALDPLTSPPEVRTIVVCNGCSDRTAEIAASHRSVEVVELAEASKVGALREGDRRAGPGPRIYLDADVVLTAAAARAVILALSSGAIAGRPPHCFDTSRSGWVVRSWYRVREELPSIASALWGAGCYGLSEAGRARFDEFPDIVSDDLFIHNLFDASEISIVDTDPVVVTAPRRTADLVRILQRSYRTQSDVAGVTTSQRGQLHDLRSILRARPSRIADATVYVAVIAYARLRARVSRSGQTWERDESSRESV